PHASRNFVQRFGAAHRRDVFFEDLIGGRRRGSGGGRGGFGVLGLRIAGEDRRRSHWVVTAAMAGIARHFLAAAEAVLIDGQRHGDHLARGLLSRLVVGIELALHVAEVAFHSERGRDELHGREYLIGRRALQGLNVLESLLGGLAGRGGLGVGRHREGQGACHYGCNR